MKSYRLYLVLIVFLVVGSIGIYFLYQKWESNITSTVSSDAPSKQGWVTPLYTFTGAFTGIITVPGLTLSGGALYGDASKIKVNEKGVLSVLLPDPSIPDSYQALVAPPNALPAGDFRFRRVARALGTPRPEDLARISAEEREKYDLLKTLFSAEAPIDPLAVATKKCFVDTSVSMEIPGAPKFLQELCQSVAPKDLVFTSVLDPAYVRYSYSLFAQAYAIKNKSPCLSLLTTQLSNIKPIDRARDHLQSLMLCEAIAAQDSRMAIDRVYSIRFLLGKKRCDPYVPFPEAQKLCEEILSVPAQP
jgi:hypothetical protein